MAGAFILIAGAGPPAGGKDSIESPNQALSSLPTTLQYVSSLILYYFHPHKLFVCRVLCVILHSTENSENSCSCMHYILNHYFSEGT